MMSQSPDETAIRFAIEECVAGATNADLNQIMPHLAPDLTYFLVGEPPMRGREAFVAMMTSLLSQCTMKAEVEIEEVQLMGDYAYCLNRLTLTLAPKEGGTPRRRSGHTLSLLRREPNGRWVVFRNANLLPEL
jgi:uncharacterized protein (TIGR02246 family)